LAAPYERPSSVNFGATLTVQQIAEQMLPGVEWTIDWTTTAVWSVPAGSYSYSEKTPIEAIGELAKSIGAMVIPAIDSKTLYIKPCYPVLPWNFGTTDADIEIPESALISLTEEPTSSYNANGVYIHGGEIGGAIALVRRTSTAGDRLAQTQSNNLMTDAVGIRSLGERVLAGEHAQPEIQALSTFLDSATMPLALTGDYIAVTVGGTETKGIVSGASINVNDAVDITQSLNIGETTGNVWTAFRDILPKRPTLIATMSTTDGTTSLMQLIDGGVARVRGTGSPGSNYYIREGEIVSDAPNVISLSEVVV